jgi:hypothetical protein
MRRASLLLVLLCTVIALFVVVNVSAQEPAGSDQQSIEELNRQLQNPVSSVWNIVFQFNNFFLNGEPSDKTRVQNVLNFQPVLPFRLTEDLNLIVRPVLPFIFTSPVFTPGEGFDQKSGFDDMAFVPFLSPSKSGNWILGAGPTFIFPTASKEELGQGKLQLGPAGVIGWFNSRWMAGVFPQQWWSVAGDDARPETSQANIQYFIFRFLPDAWLVGMAPNILINWKAEDKNKVTFPVGASVGKTVKIGKLPVNFRIEGQWMFWHPDDFGQRWNIQLVIKPVIPSLIPGVIF